MDPRWFGLIEAALVFGLVMGFGAWQLWQLRRLERTREKDQRNEEAARDGDGDGD